MQELSQAWTCYAQGDFRTAAELSRKLLVQFPDDPAVMTCDAMCRWTLGADADACIARLERAAGLAPTESWIRHNLGTVLASTGRLEEACARYLEAIALKPEDTQAFYGFSQNFKFTEESAVVRQMLDLYAGGGLPQRGQEYVCFALAKVYGDLGKHVRAIHFCIEGNWLARRPYDADRPRSELEELRQMAAAGAFRRMPAAPRDIAAPLFIVGMPRSGTTLVETILSRHPAVFAGGEMQHMPDVERALQAWARQKSGFTGGPHEMLKLIPRDYYTRNARAVLNRVREAARGRAFSTFTDKLPENSLRLGLVARLFPGARVIHMRRHPLDCCVSILFLHFLTGNGFAFRQDLLGERYRQVAETMQVWKQTLDLPILDVSYEALVGDPEPAIRRIVRFAGLDWDPDCLTPERSGRTIATANQWHVRQPINPSSIGRWRHYEDWIQPLIKALGGFDWIEGEMREAETLAA